MLDREPTAVELHQDAVDRGAIHVNDQRWPGRYCVLRPDPDVVDRWITIAVFRSVKQAEAFAAGYCARRDEQPRCWNCGTTPAVRCCEFGAAR